MKVTIDLRESLSDNAKKYYDKAKKSKRKLPGLEQALKKTQEKLDKLSLEEIVVEQPEIIKKRDKKWFEKFRWFTSSDGYLVIGGRDATSNEILIKKHMENNDLVFHANVQGAPFFIVKNPEKTEIPESTKIEAAQAAASYSSAWKAGLRSCDVYYVNPDQVSKTPPTGEYLAKGAFMIYGKKNWFRKSDMEIAIGYSLDEPHVIGGPITAVEKHAEVFVKLSSGDEKAGMLCKRIRKVFSEKEFQNINLEDIQYFIPSGKGKIIS